ncbi:helix-turn-helix domain-containing protein [Blastomonas sp.]|uniref:helix-turn-helix domain-containing protein n=1 Tax=Blastomonas sp. TaxID=1909299 RepID=UPI00406A4980
MLDWHPETIKALIRAKGVTLAALGQQAGISRQVMSLALDRPHRTAEAIISEFLGTPAHDIWPSRYHSNGARKRPQPRTNYVRRRRFHRQGVSA